MFSDTESAFLCDSSAVALFIKEKIMNVVLGLFAWAAIIGGIVFFVKRKKAKRKAEEERKELEEMRQQEENERLEKEWAKKKKEYSTRGLPVVVDENLNLSKDEICHYVGSASFCKIKKETTGYSGGSRGVSVRVAKGVSFRVGNYKGHPIREDVVEKSCGKIYLTNKKIIFSALKNACVVRIDNIINMNVFEQLLQLQTEKKNYLFDLADSFNFLLILDCIINKSESESTFMEE